MNKNFHIYISAKQKIAEKHDLNWDLIIATDGKIQKDNAWDLNIVSKIPPPPFVRLSNLGYDAKVLKEVNLERRNQHKQELLLSSLSIHWQNLIKAIVVDALILGHNKPAGIMGANVRPLRVLATCCVDIEPWTLTREHIGTAIKLAERSQPSGKLASDIVSTVRTYIDANHLVDNVPLGSDYKKMYQSRHNTSKTRNTTKIRKRLDERKNDKQLPYEETFWETVRIIFTEKPNSFTDKIRFSVIQSLILCGFRGNEACMIPIDWQQWLTHTTHTGQSTKSAGGIGKSLRLKYFAEKQRKTINGNIAFYPTYQEIPQMYEKPLQDSLTQIEVLTAPLRNRLKAQIETDRIFPEFELDELVSVTEFYPRLTGDPFIYEMSDKEKYVEKYKQDNFSVKILHDINHIQTKLAKSNEGILNKNVRIYIGHKLEKNSGIRPPFRDRNGTLKSGKVIYATDVFNVGEFEDYLKKTMPTKLSDAAGFTLTDGTILQPYNLLFIAPKRAMLEERNNWICDITQYAFVGRTTLYDVAGALTPGTQSNKTIFTKYSTLDNAADLSINSHAFRHLQNTELFRLGVADTVITKRFNRRSVAQSYEYDHRSLIEDLKDISVPEKANELLHGKAMDVFKLIKSNKVRGPIVYEFLAIQKNEGNQAAYEYLVSEADGFHTTPYGHCINSFTVDPCPKHLECFNGCHHLTRSGIKEHTTTLISLAKRMELQLKSIDNHPAPSGVKNNMKQDTKNKLNAIYKILDTPVGDKVYSSNDNLNQRPLSKNTSPFKNVNT